MNALSSLLYISLASPSADEQTLQHILATSRQRNAALGISGALLKYAGYYLQVLEGEHQTVQCLYERIRLDTRHVDVRVVALEAVTERQFSGWAMHHVPPPRSTDRAVGAFLRGLWSGKCGAEAHLARALLRRLASAAAPATESSPSATPARRSATAPPRRSAA